MTVTAKNRVMIFGPKADGTYVLSSRRQRGRRCDLNPRNRGSGAQIFPGAYAVWAVRAGRSVVNADRPAARVAIHLCVLSERPKTDTLLWGVSMQRCVHAGCRRSNVNTFTGGLHKRRPWRTDRARVSLAGWGVYGGLGGTPPGANTTPWRTQWFLHRERPPGGRWSPAGCKTRKAPPKRG